MFCLIVNSMSSSSTPGLCCQQSIKPSSYTNFKTYFIRLVVVIGPVHLCKTSENSCSYWPLPSTACCGKLVEKASQIWKTFLGVTFPLDSQLRRRQACGKVEIFFQVLQIRKIE